MSTETRLREELRAWADELGPDAGPDVSAASFTDLHHRRLRHRAALLAAAVAVVVAAVAVPLLVSRSDPRPAPAAPVSLFDLPTRGPLAGNAAFLAAAVRLSWGGGVPAPPVSSRHVVWAGDVPGGQRWVLVVGENTAVPADDDPEHQTDLGAISPVALALFIGPAGAPADELVLATVPRGQTADVPFAVQDAVTGDLLVVAAPGDEIEVSDRPEIGADGSESRIWRSVAGPDGVAVLRADPLRYTGGLGPLQYRVFRDRLEVFSARSPDTFGQGADTPIPYTAVHGPVPDDLGARDALSLLAAPLGLPPEQFAAVVAWQGEVPGPGDGHGPAVVTLATVTAPSGAVLVDALWKRSLDDLSGYGSSCGEWLQLVLPAGPPAAERTYAFACTVTDAQGGNPVRSFVVAAPPSAVRVRMYDGSGAQVAEATLTDGVVVLPDTGTVGQRAAEQVEAFTADGTSLGRTPVLSG